MQGKHTPYTNGEQIVRENFDVEGEDRGVGHDTTVSADDAHALALDIDRAIESALLNAKAEIRAAKIGVLTQFVATHFREDIFDAPDSSVEAVTLTLLETLALLREHRVTPGSAIRARQADSMIDIDTSRYYWHEPREMRAAHLLPGAAFAHMVVGLIGHNADWSAYVGPHDWPVDHVAAQGILLPKGGADLIFPTAAQHFVYHE